MAGRIGGVQTRRLVIACVIVVCLIALPPVTGAVINGMRGGPAEGAGQSSLVQAGLDPYSMLNRVQERAESTLGSPPEAFMREIGLLPGAYDVRVSQDEGIVGYEVELGSAEASEQLDTLLEDAGWVSVPLGGVDGATYLKSEGEYRWVLVTTTWVGASTSVVIRCPR